MPIDAFSDRTVETQRVLRGVTGTECAPTADTAIFYGAAPVTIQQLLAQADALMYEQKRNRLPSMRIEIIDA